MSYCRFSSLNWKSNVYVYESCYGGYRIEVASRRRLFSPIPDIMCSKIYFKLLKLIGTEYNGIISKTKYKYKYSQYLESLLNKITAIWHNHIHMGSLRIIPLINIKHEESGESYGFDTAFECAEKLEELKAKGFIVPQIAIDLLKEESHENSNL